MKTRTFSPSPLTAALLGMLCFACVTGLAYIWLQTMNAI